jgi:hypothetical protein
MFMYQSDSKYKKMWGSTGYGLYSNMTKAEECKRISRLDHEKNFSSPKIQNKQTNKQTNSAFKCQEERKNGRQGEKQRKKIIVGGGNKEIWM